MDIMHKKIVPVTAGITEQHTRTHMQSIDNTIGAYAHPCLRKTVLTQNRAEHPGTTRTREQSQSARPRNALALNQHCPTRTPRTHRQRHWCHQCVARSTNTIIRQVCITGPHRGHGVAFAQKGIAENQPSSRMFRQRYVWAASICNYPKQCNFSLAGS